MKEIQLTQGQVTLVDDADCERLNQWKWYALKSRRTFYVARMSSRVNGKRHTIYMHHEIIGKPPKGFIADYKNGQGIDNQRSNLRHVTFRQNNQNLKNVEKTSQYPGVCWDKERQKWMAKITINRITKNLGRFLVEIDAFDIYQQAVNILGQTVIDYD